MIGPMFGTPLVVHRGVHRLHLVGRGRRGRRRGLSARAQGQRRQSYTSTRYLYRCRSCIRSRCPSTPLAGADATEKTLHLTHSFYSYYYLEAGLRLP